MSIVLDTSNLLDAARELLPPDDAASYESIVVAATQMLAEHLARHTGVTLSSVEFWDGKLYASFRPGPNNKTSPTLAQYDPEGEWS